VWVPVRLLSPRDSSRSGLATPPLGGPECWQPRSLSQREALTHSCLEPPRAGRPVLLFWTVIFVHFHLTAVSDEELASTLLLQGINFIF